MSLSNRRVTTRNVSSFHRLRFTSGEIVQLMVASLSNSTVRRSAWVVASLVTILAGGPMADACTNLLVSRGASTDGSVFLAFSVDGPALANLRLSHIQAAPPEKPRHPAELKFSYPTYRGIGFMNEYQVGIGETTLVGGRHELTDSTNGGLHYSQLMFNALKRSKTARQCVELMGEYVREFGYSSEPEIISVTDKNEAWIFEITGKGKGEKGAVWVAARVPDGHITVHANLSRITTFPLDDSKNWLYSPDVISFAVKKGYYDPKSGKPFSFRAAYHPNISKLFARACAGRVWSIYRRAAPSQKFSPAYFRNEKGAKDYPLFIKPDKKISLHDVMQLMRDHFEGTPWDMTKGVAAGPFGNPYRYRDLTWEVDGKKYAWERPISSQQASCTFIAQSRNWLPDKIGGVYWFTPDDAYTSCFAPFYCGITRVPTSYRTGDHNKFSWDSAWWVSNFVSNYTYERWSKVLPDVQKVQREYESRFITMQPIIEETALKLAKTDEKLMNEFLTNYCVSSGSALFTRWQQLGGELVTKHVDGYVHKPNAGPKPVGYPKRWLRHVRDTQGYQYYLEDVPKKKDKKVPAGKK
jgi:dipeptidase